MAGTVNRLNIEHRTFNIERPMWMALRFIYFKKVNRSLQHAPPSRFDRTDHAFLQRQHVHNACAVRVILYFF